MTNEIRSLYLEGREALRVMRDGPALRVRKEGASDQLFPIPRLSRVVVTGQVAWDTEALLACAEASVPVVFVGKSGNVRATVSGSVVRRVDVEIASLLEQLLEHPGREYVYRDWVYALGHQARRRLILEQGRIEWPNHPGVLRRVLTERLQPCVRLAELRRFDKALYGLLHAQIETLLREAAIDPHAPILLAVGIELARDVSEIVGWSMQDAKRTFIRHLWHVARRTGRRTATLGWSDAVRFHESQAQFIDERFVDLLRRLQIRLLEELRHYGRS